MERIGIYGTANPEIHRLIGEILERKTGNKVNNCVMSHHKYLYSNGTEIHGTHENSGRQYHYRLVSLEELDSMPDHVAAKEMTVEDICNALGYNVKIVK